MIYGRYGDEFAGVLLYEGGGEDKKYRALGKTIYVKIFDFLQNTFVKNGVGVYDEANRKMFRDYSRKNTPDGEIIFLAADPEIKGKRAKKFSYIQMMPVPTSFMNIADLKGPDRKIFSIKLGSIPKIV